MRSHQLGLMNTVLLPSAALLPFVLKFGSLRTPEHLNLTPHAPRGNLVTNVEPHWNVILSVWALGFPVWGLGFRV